MSKNKVKMNICSTDYTIVSDDAEDYIVMVGEEVNNEMKDTLEKGKISSVATAAVLTALKYCDKLKKSEQNADNLRKQIKRYIEDSSKALTKAKKLESEITRLKEEIRVLKDKKHTKQNEEKNIKNGNNKKDKEEDLPGEMFSSEELLREETNENMSFFE